MALLPLDTKSPALVLLDLQRGIAAGNRQPHSAADLVAHYSTPGLARSTRDVRAALR
jgi:hypothetical protein